MKFSDIHAHIDLKRYLTGLADSGKLPHALLISGPEGAGKLALARALAQYIHCPHRHDGDSCGVCPSCMQHRSLNHADMHYIFPIVKKQSEGVLVSNDCIEKWREFMQGRIFSSWEGWLNALDAGNSRPVIYVNEAAEILRVVNMSTYSAPVKILLVWLPEKLQPEAANKLLKVIEEPWEDTCFIFVSNDPSSILPTIYSRTQRVNVPRLNESEIAELLSKDYSVDPAQAEVLARRCDGNFCTALSMLGTQGEAEEFASIFRDVMRRAYSRDVKALRELADTIAGFGREKNGRLLEYFAQQVRENFIYNLAVPQLNRLSADEENFSRRFSPFINAANVEGIIADIDAAASDIARNANAKIVMFDTFLRLIVLLIKKPQ